MASPTASGAGEIHLHYLNHPDVQALALSDAEIVAAVENGLVAQGRGETTIEPRMHLKPEKDGSGHFNVLRGYIRPLAMAGVKVVGENAANLGRADEINLFDANGTLIDRLTYGDQRFAGTIRAQNRSGNPLSWADLTPPAPPAASGRP